MLTGPPRVEEEQRKNGARAGVFEFYGGVKFHLASIGSYRESATRHCQRETLMSSYSLVGCTVHIMLPCCSTTSQPYKKSVDHVLEGVSSTGPP